METICDIIRSKRSICFGSPICGTVRGVVLQSQLLSDVRLSMVIDFCLFVLFDFWGCYTYRHHGILILGYKNYVEKFDVIMYGNS